MAAFISGDGRSEEHTSELQSHRDLHSFPTRRSSDSAVRDNHGFGRKRDHRRVAVSIQFGIRRWRLSSRATVDRKSTRLNSSHTEIYTLSLHDALPILPFGIITALAANAIIGE